MSHGIDFKDKTPLAAHIGKRCPYCNVLMGDPLTAFWAPSRDHLHPRVRGGSHCGNIIICCRRCNSDKGSCTLWEWIVQLVMHDDARAEHVIRFSMHLARSAKPSARRDIAHARQPACPAPLCDPSQSIGR